jgi:hypothetical protein
MTKKSINFNLYNSRLGGTYRTPSSFMESNVKRNRRIRNQKKLLKVYSYHITNLSILVQFRTSLSYLIKKKFTIEGKELLNKIEKNHFFKLKEHPGLYEGDMVQEQNYIKVRILVFNKKRITITPTTDERLVYQNDEYERKIFPVSKQWSISLGDHIDEKLNYQHIKQFVKWNLEKQIIETNG